MHALDSGGAVYSLAEQEVVAQIEPEARAGRGKEPHGRSRVNMLAPIVVEAVRHLDPAVAGRRREEMVGWLMDPQRGGV